ncbi:FAD dependent oxidoreductase [Pleurostoma richardsiae]|uniref:FAD dependent oxidoreductase n=1 Tax=Pleurostoma richardsiae TaxID=41990 RepID=A0AA38VE06_9PEZI|nr:FAD dependent oxidoreductase [Pleurostoma richardsiae]
MADEKENIVIIGGGVIGCCAAYYLTRHPSYDPSKHTVTLLESTRLAGGASGKAGGLLAQWAYPASLVPLSFDLHAELAQEHDGPAAWGYRTIRCGKLTARDRTLPPPADEAAGGGAGGALGWAARQVSWALLGKRREVSKDERNIKRLDNLPQDLDWFEPPCIDKYEDIAPAQETAQVHPHQFTLAMARLAEEKGARILSNSPVEELEYAMAGDDDSGAGGGQRRKVVGVRYVDKASGQATLLPASKVILAAGPWTPNLFPMLPMSAIRAHSVTIRPTRPVSAYCLFTEISFPLEEDEKQHEDYDHDSHEAAARVVCPEVYSRPNNEVYVAGEGDSRVPLPPTTEEVEVDREACNLIVDAVGGISQELGRGLVTSRRACYLPTVDLPSGGPLVGATWVEGLLLATGHSCWGIHNAPGTGKVISEIVFDGHAVSADISALDPQLVT